MKLLILLALSWKFSFSMKSFEFCNFCNPGELYLNCDLDECDSERIHAIKDESVICGDEEVLRENITTLSIRRCIFNEFNLFKNCTKLKLHFIEDIHSMQKETLSELNQLTDIEFMYTDPKEMTWLASAISGLSNLRSVHCYGSNLTMISASAFQGVHHLKKLEIAEYTNPSISSLPPGLFRDLNQLETLILDLSEMSNFSAIDFTGLEKLTWLSIHMKQVSFIPAKMYIPKSLRYLVLQDNGIRDIASTSFSQMPNLIRLEMSLNQIERLPANAFIGLTDLRVLSLWDNSIDRIENGAFTALKNLKKLDLSNNRLTALDEYTFKGLLNLKYLNLGSNSISTITINAFSALPNLVQLILSEQDGLVTIDLNAFPQFVDLQTKTVVYTAISTEPDDFDKKEMQRLAATSFVKTYMELFGSFWIDETPDHQVDLNNLTQSMTDQSLIFGNLDLSSNRITSINIDHSHEGK